MNCRNEFKKYIVPSVLAFALSGIYTVVDGFFIGNSLGDPGLAAINLAYPIAALIQALGTGIGLTGAIRFSIFKAQGKKKEERQYFSSTILLLAITSVIVTGVFFIQAVPVLRLLGANGDILKMANEYVVVIAIGTVFQMYATGLIPFIRNLGGATYAMVAMIAGFITNTILDYLFVLVLNWGMAGAAWATVIGQGVTMFFTIGYLLRKKPGFELPNIKELPKLFGSILKMALSPFGLTYTHMLTLIPMNRFLLIYGGEKAIAIYACITYITAIIYLLLQGVGDGSQPLFSKYYGTAEVAGLKATRLMAYKTAGAIAILCMVVFFFARKNVGFLFGASETVNQELALILPLYLASLFFLSFTRVTTSFFQSTEQSGFSYLLVYAEPILLLLTLMVLPRFMGLNGVWLAVPLAQLLTWIIALLAKRKVDRRVLST